MKQVLLFLCLGLMALSADLDAQTDSLTMYELDDVVVTSSRNEPPPGMISC